MMGGQKPAGDRELRRVHLGEEASDFPPDPSCKTAGEPGSAGWGGATEFLSEAGGLQGPR